MRALIIGAAGMIGGRLAASLAADPLPGLDALTLVDVVAPAAPAGVVPATTAVLDLTDAAALAAAVADRPEVIVHLSAIVSGEAEADFEKGYAVNFDGTRALLEAKTTRSRTIARASSSPRRSPSTARLTPTSSRTRST